MTGERVRSTSTAAIRNGRAVASHARGRPTARRARRSTSAPRRRYRPPAASGRRVGRGATSAGPASSAGAGASAGGASLGAIGRLLGGRIGRRTVIRPERLRRRPLVLRSIDVHARPRFGWSSSGVSPSRRHRAAPG